MIYPGLYSFIEKKQALKKIRFAVLSHQAACDLNYRFTVRLLLNEGFNIVVIFSPEHGFFSEEQDQKFVPHRMLWKIPVFSLYGENLVPPDELLRKFDALIIDLVDIGARYYTYIWTAVLFLKRLSGKDKKVFVLDRPNPLGGDFIEGPILKEKYFSFVGLLPLPVVHGMTFGELIKYAVDYYKLDVDVEICPVKGYKRSMGFYEFGLDFIPPSPNMPFITTAYVYPGMCLLEATNISEGRGTTRPFEVFGAPFVNPFELVEYLGFVDGAVVRPYYFIPTFNKYKGMLIGGGFIHVKNFKRFKPFSFGIKLIKAIRELYGDKFKFRSPPYEYEKEKMPFDILTGSDFIRKHIDKLSLEDFESIWEKDVEKFRDIRERYLIYA